MTFLLFRNEELSWLNLFRFVSHKKAEDSLKQTKKIIRAGLILAFLVQCKENLPTRVEPASIEGVAWAGFQDANFQFFDRGQAAVLSNLQISLGAKNTFYKTLEAEREVRAYIELWIAEDPNFRRILQFEDNSQEPVVIAPGEIFPVQLSWDHTNDEGVLIWDYFEPDCSESGRPDGVSLRDCTNNRMENSCTCLLLHLNGKGTLQVFKGKQSVPVEIKNVAVLHMVSDAGGECSDTNCDDGDGG